MSGTGGGGGGGWNAACFLMATDSRLIMELELKAAIFCRTDRCERCNVSLRFCFTLLLFLFLLCVRAQMCLCHVRGCERARVCAWVRARACAWVRARVGAFMCACVRRAGVCVCMFMRVFRVGVRTCVCAWGASAESCV